VEEWRSGGVEEWRSRGVEEWRSGGVEESRRGNVRIEKPLMSKCLTLHGVQWAAVTRSTSFTSG